MTIFVLYLTKTVQPYAYESLRFYFFFLRFIFKNHRLQHYMRLIRIYLRRVFIDKIPIIS